MCYDLSSPQRPPTIALGRNARRLNAGDALFLSLVFTNRSLNVTLTVLRSYDVTLLQCYDITLLRCRDVTLLRCTAVTMLRPRVDFLYVPNETRPLSHGITGFCSVRCYDVK